MKNKFKDKFKIMLFGAALIIIGGIISVYIQTKAGSLTPPGSPGGTMYSLSDIAGSGFSTGSDSLKQIKSAILPSFTGTPSLGSDMLNQYFMEQGLFTPHTSTTCDGTEAFVEIKSGSGKGYCIEKNERAVQHWEDAKYTCANAGKRLAEPFEWKFACQNAGSLGLSNMTGNWEWASNFSLPVYTGSDNGIGAAVFGNSGCSYANWYWVGGNTGLEHSAGFRCVR